MKLRIGRAAAALGCVGLAVPAVALAQFPKKDELPPVGKITYCTSKADRLFSSTSGGALNFVVAGYATETGRHPSRTALSCGTAVKVVKANKQATIATSSYVGKTEKVGGVTYRLDWKMGVTGYVFAWSGDGTAYFFYEA